MNDLSTRFGPAESSFSLPNYRISVGPYSYSELEGKFMMVVSSIDATLYMHKLTIDDLRAVASLINQAADQMEVINNHVEIEM